MPLLTPKTSNVDSKTATLAVKKPQLRNSGANSPTISNKPILNPPPRVEAPTNIEQRIASFEFQINQFLEETYRLSEGKDKSYEIIGAIYSRHPEALVNSYYAINENNPIEVKYYLQNLSSGLRNFTEQNVEDAMDTFEFVETVELNEAHLINLYYLGEDRKTIEATTTAVKNQDSVDLARIIYKLIHLKNGMVKIEIAGKEIKDVELKDILREICEKHAKDAVSLLIETAIALITNTYALTSLDVKMESIRLISELIKEIEGERISPQFEFADSKSQNKLIENVVSKLIASYKNASYKTIKGQFYQARTEAFYSALREWPNALPQLIRAHSQHYSLTRKAFNWVLGLFGIKPKIKDVATQVLKPLIYDLVSTPEGENEILGLYAYSPKAYPVTLPEEAERPLRLSNISRKLVLPIVENIISESKDTALPPPAEKSGAVELRDIIAEIAKELDLPAQPAKRTTSMAKRVLDLAVRIHELTFLMGTRRFNEAVSHYDDVKTISDSFNLAPPILKLISSYIYGKVFIEERDNFYSREMYRNSIKADIGEAKKDLAETAQILLDYYILKITKGNIFRAKLVKDIVEKHEDIKNALLNLIKQEYQKREKLDNLRIEIMIMYAYCFLAPAFGIAEKDIKKELEETLAQDKEWKTLAILPEVIRSQLHNYKWKDLAERIGEIIIFCESRGVSKD